MAEKGGDAKALKIGERDVEIIIHHRIRVRSEEGLALETVCITLGPNITEIDLHRVSNLK